MLKRGMLFLLVFIIFLENSLAQENTCLVASPDSIAPVAQRILNIYSRLPHLEGNEEAIKVAAIDSVNRWQPSGNVDPNWMNFRGDIISAISIFPAVPDNMRVSLPENFIEMVRRAKRELKCNNITSEQRGIYNRH